MRFGTHWRPALALSFAATSSVAMAQTYTMVVAHLLPEDLTDNEIAPGSGAFREPG